VTSQTPGGDISPTTTSREKTRLSPVTRLDG